MAFDGITIANLAKELNDLLAGGRIQKVAQPEKDEIVLSLRGYKEIIFKIIDRIQFLTLSYMRFQYEFTDYFMFESE